MYETFFGLNDLPFRLTPDPKYLFMSAKHREAFAHLLYGVNEGSGFVAITGEVGAGKTTLIRALLKQADDKVVVVYIVNPVLTSTELLQTINAELGLPSVSTSRKELIEELSAFLHRTTQAGGRTVVIVDEAQNLDPVVLEQLRLLSNLETETEKLIQIVLIGQPELHELLRRHDLRQLNQRVTVRWHLEKLDRGESREYVRHRLRVAGAQAELIEQRALDVIYEYSQGVPRLLNILAHRALLVAYTRSRGRVGVDEVAAAAVELGEASGPVQHRRRTWVYPAAAAAVLAAAVGVAGSFMMAASTGGPVPPSSSAAPALTAAPSPTLSAGTAPSPDAQGEPRGRRGRHAGAALESAVAHEEAPAVPLHSTDAAGSLPADPVAVPAIRRGSGVAEQLGAGSAFDSAARGVGRLLELWHADALTPAELASGTLDLDAVASSRGLRYLAAQMNRPFLSLVDLPALLELQLPGHDEVRYALVEAVDPAAPQLRLAGGLEVSAESLEPWWNGRAHVFWRDADGLTRDLGPGNGGPVVRKLQELLRDAGVYEGAPSGLYDELTENAVRRFQEAHSIRSDGIAGPITQILLYNSLARVERPTLLDDGSRAGRSGAT